MTGRAAGLLEQAENALEGVTPGPWHEDGTLVGPDGEETDARTDDYEDWVTFRTRRADADRAFWIAAHELVPELAGRLRPALAAMPYAVHKIRCEKVKALGEGRDENAVACTCGLDAALRAFEEAGG